MEWSKEDTMDFIDLYHKKAIIWDPQDPDHFNKIKKQDAWMQIADTLRRPVDICKKKMETLLAALRREKMKMKKSEGTGKGAKEVYKSNWFAFTSLQFILDKNKTKPSLNTMRLQDENPQEDGEPSTKAVASAETGGSAPPAEETGSVPEESGTKRKQATPVSSKKKAKVGASGDNERLNEAFHILQSTANQANQANQDECYHFGNFIAAKLRSCDEATRCIIQNDIMNIFTKSYPRPHPPFQAENHPPSHNNPTPVPLPYPSTSTSPDTYNYNSQNHSPSNSQEWRSPNHSSYSGDFNILELI